MTITNGYATAAQVQARLNDAGSSITWTNDEVDMIEIAIEAASRWIDNYTGRRFFSATETRYYTAEWHDTVYVDDLISVSSLTTDDDQDRTYSTTWLTTDYDLMPFNAQLEQPPRPYTRIAITPDGNESFPTKKSYKGVKVTGVFGYCTSANRPPTITEACIMLALRLYKRKDAIFGVASAPALGVSIVQAQITTDADIVTMLKGYCRDYF